MRPWPSSEGPMHDRQRGSSAGTPGRASTPLTPAGALPQGQHEAMKQPSRCTSFRKGRQWKPKQFVRLPHHGRHMYTSLSISLLVFIYIYTSLFISFFMSIYMFLDSHRAMHCGGFPQLITWLSTFCCTSCCNCPSPDPRAVAAASLWSGRPGARTRRC